MELHYYKRETENEEYFTWEFNDDAESYHYGWNKKPKPGFANKSQEAIDWYNNSNMEDKHFILMEKKACLKHCDIIINEIDIANKHNKKLGYMK